MTDRTTPADAPNPVLWDHYPFLRRLFDFSFRSFVTPSIAKMLFALAIVMITLEFVIGLIAFLIVVGGAWTALFLVVALVWSWVQLVAARVSVEWTIAFFEMATSLRTLATNDSPEGT